MITITPVTKSLYSKFNREQKPQPCYVELDCETGDLVAYVSGEIGNGVPFRVYHSICQRWGIPVLKEGPVNELLAEIAPLAQTIVDGFSTHFDGQNIVGVYKAEALEAIEAVNELCAVAGQNEGDCVVAWHAEDWFAPCGWQSVARDFGVTGETSDLDLAVVVTRAEVEAEHSGHCDELLGCHSYFEWLREKVKIKVVLDDAEAVKIEPFQAFEASCSEEDERANAELAHNDWLLKRDLGQVVE